MSRRGLTREQRAAITPVQAARKAKAEQRDAVALHNVLQTEHGRLAVARILRDLHDPMAQIGVADTLRMAGRVATHNAAVKLRKRILAAAPGRLEQLEAEFAVPLPVDSDEVSDDDD